MSFNLIIKELKDGYNYLGPVLFWSLAGLVCTIFVIRLLHKHHVNILEKNSEKTAENSGDLTKLKEEIKPVALVNWNTYREGVKAFLGWLNGKLGPQPWGPKAYDWCLRLAVAYPIAGIFLIWTITGENTSGIQGLLPEVGGAKRGVSVVALLLFLFSIYKLQSSTGWRNMMWIVTSAGAGAGVVAVAFAGTFAGAVAVAFAVAFAIAFAGAFAVAVAFAFVVAFAVAFALAGFADAFAVAFAVAFAGTVAGAGVGAIGYFQGKMTENSQESIAHVITWCLLLFCGITISYWLASLQFNEVSRSLLVFLVILPLVNVAFDWFSLGVTRKLLHNTLNGGNPIRNGLLDAVAAVVILIALAIAVTCVLQLANILAYAGGAKEPMINLHGIIKTLRNRPEDPAIWWVYIMLFSTLLPSLVHAVIAAGHVVTFQFLPKDILRRHKQAFEEGFDGEHIKLLKTARTMTFRRVAAVCVALPSVAALAVLLWVFHLGLPQLAKVMLDTAETIAGWQGSAFISLVQ